MGDADASGTLSKEEFVFAFSEDAVKEKLTRMGVDVDEMDSLFDSLDEDKSGDISLGEVLSGFIHLRNPATAASRLLMAMEREFLNHDKDMDLTLTRAEFRQFMQTPAEHRQDLRHFGPRRLRLVEPAGGASGHEGF